MTASLTIAMVTRPRARDGAAALSHAPSVRPAGTGTPRASVTDTRRPARATSGLRLAERFVGFDNLLHE